MTILKRIIMPFLVALIVGSIGLELPAFAAPSQKDIVAQAEAIQNPASDLKIEIWPERTDRKYNVGELVTLMFKANKDCFVNIIDIGTSGKVKIIFPNQWHKSNKIEMGKTYRLPQEDSKFVFKVNPPAGENYVKAIATLNKLELVKPEYLESGGAFVEIKDPEHAIRDIGMELGKIGGKQWAEADTKIIISESASVTTEPLKPVSDDKPLVPEKPGAAVQTGAKTAKDIVAVAASIENPKQEFGVKLSIVDSRTSFAVGEEIRFSFSAERDCYVTLLDIGTSGKVHKLFPNKWHESNKVEKDKVYRIPPDASNFIFRIEGPVGREYVKAIATLKPIEKLEGAVAVSKGAFSEIKNADAVLKDIGTELAQQDVRNWSEATISFDITDNKTTSDKPMSLKLWSDKKVYSPGEKIVFHFESDRDCNLTLIDIGTSGIVKEIFPNKYQTDNFIKANTRYEIPKGISPDFAYRVESPAGINTIKAICTNRSAPALTTSASFDKEDFPSLGNKDQVLKDISVQLNKIGQNGYSQVDYTIEIK